VKIVPAERTQLRRSPQTSPTHRRASQALTPLLRTAGCPIADGWGERFHSTAGARTERLLAIPLPPPLFMIRFR
jgi:hypothetical protein